MMKEEVRQAVLEILRGLVLIGSAREIGMENPLGEQGLGLDSLALVEFVTALEKRFGVEIPDSIWTDRGELSPENFVDLIAQLQTRPRPAASREKSGAEFVGAANDSYSE